MGQAFLKIGPVVMAGIVLCNLGGCVPPIEPPSSNGVTTSPQITAAVPLPCDCQSVDVPMPLSAEEQIEEALDETVTTRFTGRSLFDLATYFRDSCDIDLVIDQAALNKETVDGGMPVDVATPNISRGRLLDKLLEPMGLTWTIRDKALAITTEEIAADVRMLKTYDITELVPDHEPRDVEALIAVISEHFAPDSGTNGPNRPAWIMATPAGNGTALVCLQEYRVHRRIEELLDRLRAIARQHAPQS